MESTNNLPKMNQNKQLSPMEERRQKLEQQAKKYDITSKVLSGVSQISGGISTPSQAMGLYNTFSGGNPTTEKMQGVLGGIESMASGETSSQVGGLGQVVDSFAGGSTPLGQVLSFASKGIDIEKNPMQNIGGMAASAVGAFNPLLGMAAQYAVNAAFGGSSDSLDSLIKMNHEKNKARGEQQLNSSSSTPQTSLSNINTGSIGNILGGII